MKRWSLLFVLLVMLALPIARADAGTTTVEGTFTAGDHTTKLGATWYLPGTPGTHPLLLLVHGGSWAKGSRTDMKDIALHYTTKMHFVSLAVDYRLKVGNPKEANDVLAAIAYAKGNATKFGADSSRFVMLGSSAGANLVMMAAARGATANAMIGWSAPTDLLSIMTTKGFGLQSEVQAYIGCAVTSCPSKYTAASPVGIQTKKAPPTLLTYGLQPTEGVPPSQGYEYQALAARDSASRRRSRSSTHNVTPAAACRSCTRRRTVSSSWRSAVWRLERDRSHEDVCDRPARTWGGGAGI